MRLLHGMTSSVELARLTGLEHSPTDEQQAVIEASLTPAVVIAGAGSGKTETMAARVVWLVANGHAKPEDILGLTFTRKAAGELQHRIRSRLARYNDSLPGEWPEGVPTVLTYAAYAGQLVAEHAMLLGVEPGARLLTEAARWQVADSVVRGYDAEFAENPGAIASVIDYVLQLSGEFADHLASVEDVRAMTDAIMAELRALPRKKRQSGEWPSGPVTDFVKTLGKRVELLPIVEAFESRKRDDAVVDFAEQMVLAARLARLDSVAEIERGRYKVVLLDEYQDTGHAQIEMLSALFGDGRAVTAVGDPLQSIYGWRGASSGNIGRFTSVFRDSSGNDATVYPLMTSWRNDRRILTVANEAAAPLRDDEHTTLTARPGAGDGHVEITFGESELTEAAWIADKLAAEWVSRDTGERAFAVLVRRRALIAEIAAALTARNLPVEVVDLGGLLTLPEIADVVAVLRVLVDPQSGGSLNRLLSGARWRISPADLMSLYQHAKYLAKLTNAAAAQAADEPRADGQAATEGVDDGDDERVNPSLVEALDDLNERLAMHYSAEGFRRLTHCAAMLRHLRRRLDLPLPDLIDEIERGLGLDIEVAAKPGSEATGRANLDRFADEAARFAGERVAAGLSAGSGLVRAFLAYLMAAEKEESGLKQAAIEVAPERVQVLTVHGAKGLEWDVVAVAGLYDKGFPGDSTGNDWTRSRQLIPTPLRGDRRDLPALSFAGCGDTGDAEQRLNDHTDEVKARHLLEERRLAYVAFTRAKHSLYCSGAAWALKIKKPRSPSPFLLELQALASQGAVVVDGWYVVEDGDENPTAERVPEHVWPADPLNGRRADVSEGARLVRAALSNAHSGELDESASMTARAWRRDVDLLIEEHRQKQARDVIEVRLPDRLSASDMVEMRADESALAKRLRRPVPTKPVPQARRGTAFHAWLETRWKADTLLDVDELPGAVDEIIDDAGLGELKARFEGSAWGPRTPYGVEVPFEMTFAGTVVRGRMDAVFRDDDGGYTVVDWKTGAPPRGKDAEAKAIQLAVYRLAWARLNGIPDDEVHRVRAAFHYVAHDVTVAPNNLLRADELRALIEG